MKAVTNHLQAQWLLYALIGTFLWGYGLPLLKFRNYTQTHHSRYYSSRRMISPTQRPLPDNTEHSQETNIHTASGIRNNNPSKGAATEPCLRLHGQWDRPLAGLTFTILRSAHTLYLCVLCGSENKQRLFPYTTLTDWFL